MTNDRRMGAGEISTVPARTVKVKGPSRSLATGSGYDERVRRIQIYSKRVCPYCVAAKALLSKKGVPYEEIDVENDDALRAWLVETTGQRTVPQIFADGRPLGGFSDISALDRAGELDPILRGEK